MSARSPIRLSKRALLVLLACTGVLLALSSGLIRHSFAEKSAPTQTSSPKVVLNKSDIAARYGQLPLSFEPNEGQTDPQVKFLSRGQGYDLFLTSSGMVLTLHEPTVAGTEKVVGADPASGRTRASAQKGHVLRFTMVGANPKSRVEGQNELPGKINYLIGNDKSKWRTNIPTYLKVHYAEVYPKVDLVYYGNRNELEYDFIVAAGGNVNAVKFQIDGADGIKLHPSGALVLDVNKREVRLSKPVIYQLSDKGERQEIKGEYVVKGKEVGFKVKSYDSTKPLIIDPVLSYATLIGSGGHEHAFGIAVDQSGNAYITGNTNNSFFPTTPGAFQTSTGFLTGAFVTKLDATGSNLIYSTYLSGGNSGSSQGTAIAVDSAGNAYVTGHTTSTDFPTLNAIRGSANIVKTANSGTNWSDTTFTPLQSVNSIAIDPQTPATIYAATNGGTGIFKSLDNGGSWTALNSGSTSASVAALVIDPLTPSTIYAATNAPTAGIIKSTDSGVSWAFPGSLSTGGIHSLAIDPGSPATLYLGSNGGLFKTTNSGTNWTNLTSSFIPTEIVIDPVTPTTIYIGAGNIRKSTDGGVTWSTSSTGFPGSLRSLILDPTNPPVLYASNNTGVFKSTNSGGNWTSFSTGLGGSDISSLAIDPLNPATIYAGARGGKIFKSIDGGFNWNLTYSTLASMNFHVLVIEPTTPSNVYAGVSKESNPFDSEAFLTKLNDTGSSLVYSTFLGGSSSDFGFGLAIDSAGNAYVTGQTVSTDFLTVNPHQASLGGNSDAFLTKVNASGSALVYSTYLGGTGFETGRAVAVDPSGNAYVTGDTNSTNFPTASPFQSTIGSTFTTDAFVTKFAAAGTLTYSTYLGGNNSENGYAVAVDSSGHAYITGQTSSSNYPTLNPIQSTHLSSSANAFVTKLNTLGSGLVYSTYLGGRGTDTGRGIVVNSSGDAYVAGYTASGDFPVVAGALYTKSPVFKSSDGGGIWNNYNFGLTSDVARVVALHPANPSTMFVGTHNSVFKSVDGGRNWTPSAIGLTDPYVIDLVFDPLTPSTIYLGVGFTSFANAGVYKSTDGGASWTAVSSGLGSGGVTCLAIDPVTTSTLYAGVSGGLFKTTNGGASWTLVSQALFSPSSIVIDPTTPATIYASENNSNGGVFKSLDGGLNWQKLSSGLTTPFILSLAVDHSNPLTLYAGANGILFKSVDGAANWTASSSGLAGSIVGITVDPTTASTLYASASGSSGTVYKSIDSGNNWTPINSGLRYGFIGRVAINPAVPSTIYVGASVSSNNDGFVTRINAGGSAFIYSTLLGGFSGFPHPSDSDDVVLAIALDPTGNAYVSGSTTSKDFSVTSDSYQPFNRGFTDAFIAKLGASYKIAGYVLDVSSVPVSGAEVTLTDGVTLRSMLTESDGSYEFSQLPQGGNFTVSATKPNFTMAPLSQTFNNLTTDQTLNFVATPTGDPFFTISGQITNNSVGLSGVTVTLSGSQAGVRTTDSFGNYSFTVAGSGDYTVTPGKLGFTFTPASLSFNNLADNQTANFSSTRQSFVVTNTKNHGAGSLRQAIFDANTTTGVDTITFNIPGTGVQTINLQIGLPVITEPVVIDATTQPGYAGTPLIELNGTEAGSGASAFSITAGGCTIRGFSINQFTDAGIRLTTNGNNVIQANYIGVDPTGTLDRGNNSGVSMFQSSGNIIGGTTAASRNLISGNVTGISIIGSNNTITGNFIGTNAAGTAAVQSGTGVRLLNVVGSTTDNNVIGGTSTGTGNLISGNGTGIDNGAPNTTIQGNLIGTDHTGTSAVGNETGIVSSATSALVGGTTPGARNVISGNLSGVRVSGMQSRVQGNFIGTDITGTLALGNSSLGVGAGSNSLIGGTSPEARNVISANGGSGNVLVGINGFDQPATIHGNYIGTDVTGTVALNNPSAGIAITSSNNQIGGSAAGMQNVVSGNQVGIKIGTNSFSGPIGNIVQGNIIGLNALGTSPMPNASEGIQVLGSSNTIIGGTGAGAANRISFNNGPGVSVRGGLHNSIRGNSIFSNGGLAIDLTPANVSTPDGVTPNDPTDADTGTNNLQNSPGFGAWPPPPPLEIANGFKPFPQFRYEAWPIFGQFPTNLFVVYNRGADDGSVDNVVLFRKMNSFRTWNAPATLATESGVGSHLGAGGVTPTGRLLVCYGRSTRVGAGGLSMNCVHTDNEGQSWSSPVAIPHGSETGYMLPHGAIIAIDNGKIMLSWYGVTEGVHTAYVATSTDNGVTWSNPVPVATGYNEVSLAYLGGGRIIGLARKLSGISHQFLSSDNGATWIDQGEVNFPQPDNGAPFSQVTGKPIFVTSFFDRTGQRYVAAYFFNPSVPVQLYVSYGLASSVDDGPNNWLLTKWIYQPPNDGFGSTGHYPFVLHWANGPFALGAHNYYRTATSSYSDIMLFQMDAASVLDLNQSSPALTLVSSNNAGTSIQGTLNSTPNTTFQIDFYSSSACHPSGNGEGASFFDTTSVTTDPNGNAAIAFQSSQTLALGRVLTATATDPTGNTSEFSSCNSENLKGHLQFSLATYNVVEDIGAATITVVRQGGSAGAVSVNYSTADGTALAGTDYTSVSGTFDFADGEVIKTFTIPIMNDGTSEPNETVQLRLTGFADLQAIGAPSLATMVIQDPSTPLSLSMNSIDVVEGDSGNTVASINVSLSAQTGRTVTADYATAPFQATSGVDFVAASGTVTLSPGVTAQTIAVSVIGDTANEFNETFRVNLSNPVNALIANSSTIRVLDNDPVRIDTVTPKVGRVSGGQQIQLTGAFARLSTVRMGGVTASWFFGANSNTIFVTTPAGAAGSVQIDMTQSDGTPHAKGYAFAYLPTVFTDNTLVAGQTTAKAAHIFELRKAVDSLREVAGLGPVPWTNVNLFANFSTVRAIHIMELRSYLDQVATQLGYATSPYTDPSLSSGSVIKRVHLEELRQRIRDIAG